MENFENLVFIVLAAGYGKRLGGEHQKTVTKLIGKPLLKYLLDTIKRINSEKIIIVVGFKKEEVFDILKGEKVTYVEQKELKGTGHAVLQTEKILKDFNGDIIILNGDVPFISEETIKKMIILHRENGSYCTFLTAEYENPTGYGRIVRNGDKLIKIVEEINATEEEKKIKEINAGVYVFKSNSFFDTLKKIKPDPIKKEIYLTEIIGIYISENKKVITYKTDKPEETIGINTPEDLKRAEEYLKKEQKWINV